MKKTLYIFLLIVLLLISFLIGNSTTKIEDLVSPRNLYVQGELKHQDQDLTLSVRPPIGYFIEVPATDRIYVVCSEGEKPDLGTPVRVKGLLEPVCGEHVCYPSVVGKCFRMKS